MHNMSSLRSCQPSVHHTKMGEFREVSFPTATAQPELRIRSIFKRVQCRVREICVSLSSSTSSKNFIFRVQVREFGKNDRVRRVRVRSLGLYTVGPVVTVITSYIFSRTEFMFCSHN